MKPLHERRRRSARETFAACRARYKAEYLDGVDMSSAATRRGNCFHLAVELYLGWLWEHKQTDNADAAQRCLSEARIATPGLVHEEWSDVEQLWGRWAPEFRLNLATFYSVEGAQPCFDTLLRYDRVEVPDPDTLLIRDLKTFWRIPPQAQLEASWQTGFYLCAARKLFPGFRRYAMVYDFVRYATSSDVIVMDAAQLDLMEQAIKESDEAMAQAEDAGLFPATGGKHCGTCTLAPTCAMRSWDTVEYTPDSVVRHMAILDQARRSLGILLREYCEDGGAASGGGIEWAHRPKTMKRWKLADVANLLRISEEPWPWAISVSQTAMKPLLTTKRYAALRDDLYALAVVKTETEFSGKPIVADEDGEQEPSE